jgi:hypothetical protein
LSSGDQEGRTLEVSPKVIREKGPSELLDPDVAPAVAGEAHGDGLAVVREPGGLDDALRVPTGIHRGHSALAAYPDGTAGAERPAGGVGQGAVAGEGEVEVEPAGPHPDPLDQGDGRAGERQLLGVEGDGDQLPVTTRRCPLGE